MLSNAWKDYEYTQIVGNVNALSAFKNETFDMINCHNVLEYIDDKAAVVKALARVLKKDGIADVMGVTFEQSFIFPDGEQIKTSNE